MATNPSSLFSSEMFKAYAPSGVLSGDVDLTASDQLGGPCRAIYCATAGTLVVTRLDGTNVSLVFVAGATMNVVARALVASGSTATGITVMG
jgi:hypothetical protein